MKDLNYKSYMIVRVKNLTELQKINMHIMKDLNCKN